MTSEELGDILVSSARLKIASLLSVRPRTLRELADLSGITVQAVLKHLEKLKSLGVLEEKRLGSTDMQARVVYSMAGLHVGDFTYGDLTIVKMSRIGAVQKPSGGGAYAELERLAEEFMFERRRIREEARRLGRMIDDLVSDEVRLSSLLSAMRLREDERLVLHTYFTEESRREAEESLEESYGVRNARRAIDQALQKAGGLGKKAGDGDKRR